MKWWETIDEDTKLVIKTQEGSEWEVDSISYQVQSNVLQLTIKPGE